ncbi:hypothetical protein [Melghirimyces algeriensis]|uniref:Uncharacterized protein n=1 Tax=Melghirimyces algeriensis TaxID=910412 RepID=A0A521EJJ5_9BACL|nr:hypothetical protein [Melghirimyces algeriensis]SMO84052.1 hypothetical protein SAMN06264849_109111 [Melghirimyces algeriensis]
MSSQNWVKKAWSQLAGPESTRVENWINGLWIILTAVAFLISLGIREIQWSWVQLLIVILIFVDITGGVSVNASNSAKAWWHRPSQTKKDHIYFVLIHIQPFILALLFTEITWIQATVAYLFLLLASLIILSVPLFIQRLVAFIFYTLSLALIQYYLNTPPGLEWFYPLFYLKLFLAHLVKESIPEK